jgi:hypothetical protein
VTDVVPRISNPPREVFERDYLIPGRPVIITDVVSRWKIAHWSVDDLKRQLSGRTLTVFLSKPGEGRSRESPKQQMTAEEFFAATSSTRATGEYPYLLGSLLNRRGQGLPGGVASPIDLEELELPALFDPADWVNTGFYCGRQSVTSLHYHPHGEAFACAILGEKRFVLYAPEQFPYLYPHAFYDRDFACSRIPNVDHVDTSQFPRFQQARPVEAVLRPGEMLYIPIHWWHAVFGWPELSVSVTFFSKARFLPMLWPRRGKVHHVFSVLAHRERRRTFYRAAKEWVLGRGPLLHAG